MKEKEAMEAAEGFPSWVPEEVVKAALSKPPHNGHEAIRLFVRALYAKGYEVRKKEVMENADRCQMSRMRKHE